MKFTNILLNNIALIAEKAFCESMGFASRCGAYEPKFSDKARLYKKSDTSWIESFYDKIVK